MFLTWAFLQVLRRTNSSSLLYGSELWGFERYGAVEKVHMQASRLPSYTPNDMVLGNLGRFLLFVNSAASVTSIAFNFRSMQPLNRYWKNAYDTLYDTQERDRAGRNCVTQIRFLLCHNGFGYIWMYGCVENEMMFITEFKNRLRDSCCQM